MFDLWLDVLIVRRIKVGDVRRKNATEVTAEKVSVGSRSASGIAVVPEQKRLWHCRHHYPRLYRPSNLFNLSPLCPLLGVVKLYDYASYCRVHFDRTWPSVTGVRFSPAGLSTAFCLHGYVAQALHVTVSNFKWVHPPKEVKTAVSSCVVMYRSC